MEILFLDSFSTYAIADITRKWTNLTLDGMTASIEATGGRNGRPCLLFTHTTHGRYPSLTYAPISTQSGVFSATSSGICGFAIKTNLRLYYATGSWLLRLYNGGTGSIDFRLAVDGTIGLYAHNGANTWILKATSAQAVTADSWVFLEFKWTLAGASSHAEIHANGVAVLSVDFDAVAGWTLWNAIIVFNMASDTTPCLTLRVCDFYLAKADVNDDVLGDLTVAPLLPVGAGSNTGWTPSAGANYECVDEASADDDTTRVSSESVPMRDTYAFGNVVSGADIKCVQVSVLARMASVGSASLKAIIRHGSTDYASTTAIGVSSDAYKYALFPYDTNPGTSAQFSESDVNAAEFGVDRIA